MIQTDALTLAQRIRTKQLSPVAVVDALLQRIDALQPSVNAFITVTADEARDAARRAEDAVPVRRLREAGAILIGKTTTPEFGHKPLTDSPLFGVTRNPWDLSRTAGGSSGGAAAAVATGQGPLALGT